jgi:hypothetical protein
MWVSREEFFLSLRVSLSTPPISTSTKFTKNRGGVYKKDLFSVRYSPSLGCAARNQAGHPLGRVLIKALAMSAIGGKADIAN